MLLKARLGGVGLLLCIGLWNACAGPSRTGRINNAGLVVVETTGHSSEALEAIAAALLREMRDDRVKVAFYPTSSLGIGSALTPVRLTEMKAASKTLRNAWTAYYEMRLDEAWLLAEQESSAHSVNHADGLRARLLAALIRYAEQNRGATRRILEEIPFAWPSLELSPKQYPPKFIALYTEVSRRSRKRRPERMVLAPQRPLTALRRPTRELARARRWKQVWLLRVIEQDGKNWAELQQVSDGGRRFTQYRSVRFGPQARPEKVANMLWEGRAAI